MNEVFIFTRESRAEERRKARARLLQTLREGKAPGLDQMARARGLVIRERQNSIFSDAWVPLAVFFLLIGIIGDRNAALLALGTGLLIVVGLSSWWKSVALSGVTYERDFDRTHVFPGESIAMTLTISNRKLLPLTWLQFMDEVPVAPVERGQIALIASELSGSYTLRNTLSMHGFERTHRQARLRFSKRGFYQIGPVSYSSGDPFTLFTVERQHRYLDTIVVYPQVWPLEMLELPAKEIFGEVKVRQSLFVDPVKTRGIRDYQPQDRFRDVHWKASARRGNLQTKVYDPSSGMTVVTFLNVATYRKHWMGFDPELLERAVSVTGSIASYANGQGWGIGVCANGSVPGSDQPIRVAPGRAPEQLIRVLEALAAVTEFATGSVEQLMLRESARLPWAATLVLVTAIVTEEMLAGLLRLKEAGRRVVLITLAEEPLPEPTGGLLAYHIPPSLPAFQKRRPGAISTADALSSIPTPRPIAHSAARDDLEGVGA